MANQFDDLNVTSAELQSAPPKKQPGTRGDVQKFKTNAQKITLDRNLALFKYDVDIRLIFRKPDGSEGKKSLTKGPRNDCHLQYRVKYAAIALKVALTERIAEADYFYDLQANLYSTTQLKEDIHLTLPPGDVIPDDATCINVKVSITRVADTFQVSTNDTARTVNAVYGTADVTLLEALNTCVSGSLLDRDNLLSYKGHHYFANTPELQQRNLLAEIQGSQYLRVGIAEAVKPYEVRDEKGKLEENQVALHCVVDMKKTAFHEDYVILVEKFRAILGLNFNVRFPPISSNDPNGKFLLEKVKGLVVHLNYARNLNRGEFAKSIIIGGFGPPPSRVRFDYNGENTSMVQYFETRFNINLAYPNLFTVFDRKNPNVYFPPELLLLGEKQRVTSRQLLAEGQRALVESTAILPALREQQTRTLATMVGLAGDNANEKLESTGIHIDRNNLLVNGRVLPSAKIIAFERETSMTKNSWTYRKFLKPMRMPQWTLVILQVLIDQDNFLKKLRDRVTATGMVWNRPDTIIRKNDGDQYSVENIMSARKKAGTKFVFFVVRDKLEFHQEIKLLEHKYDLLTQEVRGTVAVEIVKKGQPMTVANIVNKMNLKLGGCNWEVAGYTQAGQDIIRGSQYLCQTNVYRPLIVGFETSMGLVDNLVCVGYSANPTKQMQNFIGNYKYVKQHSNIYGQVLRSALDEMLDRFVEANREKMMQILPTHLYIYLNGVSEGQYHLVANSYLQIVKQVCLARRPTPKYQPKISIMCVSKTPNERITRVKPTGEKASLQNIPPGTCIDTMIVNPVINEFFLNSHLAIQGTARTPKFSLVVDVPGMDMDFHEGLAHQLSFLHGIVSSTTALPAPLVVADRYAKRGRDNYKTHFKRRDVPRLADSEEVDFEQLNKLLTYTEKELVKVRFNA